MPTRAPGGLAIADPEHLEDHVLTDAHPVSRHRIVRCGPRQLRRSSEPDPSTARTADPAITAVAERDYGAYGIDVVPVKDAIDALAEALTITRRLWTESTPFDFEGARYRLTGAICEPKPAARLPILIGAGGEKRSLRLVAEHADIWNCPTRGDVDEFRRKSQILDEHCQTIDRDPLEIGRQVQIVVSTDPAEAAATREHIKALIDAGATEIVLAALPPWPDRLAARLAEDIIARLDWHRPGPTYDSLHHAHP